MHKFHLTAIFYLCFSGVAIFGECGSCQEMPSNSSITCSWWTERVPFSSCKGPGDEYDRKYPFQCAIVSTCHECDKIEWIKAHYPSCTSQVVDNQNNCYYCTAGDFLDRFPGVDCNSQYDSICRKDNSWND